ncbi:hypothetical protein F5051DRAFT_397767 [Lentinula edodes]|nr:hypothetical protein F5051DRAFT_397767 [Lentinula edodes]
MAVNPSWDPSRSPYAPFLDTNYAASPSERLGLQAFLSEPEQELSHLDSEISRTEALLDELRAQRDQVKTFVYAHRALMAPIRRLPAETLAEIFVHCLPTDRYPWRTLKEAPLLLTMVCREWRDIAIKIPSLWNSFHIHIVSEPTLRCWEKGIAGWIARSGVLPLYVSLCIKKIRPILMDEASILQTLMKFSSRFREAVFDLDALFFPMLDRHFPLTFPMLESLSISVPNSNSRDTLTAIPLVGPPYLELPMLQRLSINGFARQTHTRSSREWANITVLVLESTHPHTGLPLDQILGILGQTTKLKTCRISISDSAQQMMPVNLPSLHSLWIRFDNTDQPWNAEISFRIIKDSFHALNCPSLKVLSVTWQKTSLKLDMVDYYLAFTHLLCSIHTLRLEFPMTSEALIKCLELAQNLAVLEIIDCIHLLRPSALPGQNHYYYQFQDSLLRKLTDTSTSAHLSPVLCPHLETLRYVIHQSYEAPDMSGLNGVSTLALLEFMESRCISNNRMRKLKVCDVMLPPDAQPTDVGLLERLRNLQDGMRVRVLYSELQGMYYLPDVLDTNSPLLSLNFFPPLHQYILNNYTLTNTEAYVDNIGCSS